MLPLYSPKRVFSPCTEGPTVLPDLVGTVPPTFGQSRPPPASSSRTALPPEPKSSSWNCPGPRPEVLFFAVLRISMSPRRKPQYRPLAGSFCPAEVSPQINSGARSHGLVGLGPAVAMAATLLAGVAPPKTERTPQKRPFSG